MSVHKDKKRGTWRVALHYEDAAGNLVNTTKRGFKTKSEALAWERDALADASASIDMKFESLYKLYEADVRPRVRATTWDQKQHVATSKILLYFGKKKVSSITAKDIMAWQNELMTQTGKNGKPYTMTYLRTVDNQLSAVFNHAVRYYGLAKNPVVEAGRIGEKNAEEMSFWTTDEYLRFSETLLGTPAHFYAFEILYWCGIREGEPLALTPSDFDFKKGTLSITKSYTRLRGEDIVGPPKTKKSIRDVQMPAFLAEEIEEYLSIEANIASNDRIFPITKHALRAVIKRGARAAGLKEIRVHDLRHSHASLLINLGFPAIAIADRLGHESVHITYHYSHLFPSQQQNMASVLNALISDLDGDEQ